MAMMISKFHKLIQSKILWGIFLIVIVFSFVIWGMQSPGRSRRAREESAAGRLDGRFVSQEEFRGAYRNEYVGLLLSVGSGLRITDEMDALIRQAAWRRLAALREGRRLGLGTPDTEVVAAIRSQPVFQEDGRFSLARYRGFLQQALGETGLSEAFFEEHVRQELLLQKLRRLVEQTVLVPPLDVERTFRALSDRFTVQYATLSRADVTNGVQVTDEQVRAHFERDPAAYERPPQVEVRYVFFDARRFLPDVPEPDPRDVEDYYADHATEFRVRETFTNETAAADGTNGTAEAEVETRWVTRPLEDVQPEVIRRLRVEAARARARTEADAFTRRISSYFQEKPMGFDEAARAMGLDLYAPKPFAGGEVVPGVAAGRAFSEAAFELRDNPDEYYSRPVTGEDGVYIAALTRRIPARVPELEEVRDLVRRDVFEEAVTEALLTRARDLRRRAGEEGEPFAETARALGATLHEPAPFSPVDGFEGDEPYGEVLMRGVLHRNAGEVTDVVQAGPDTVLVARVAARERGEAERTAELKPQVTAMLHRERGRQLFEAWQEHLLRRGGFEERIAPPAAEETDA